VTDRYNTKVLMEVWEGRGGEKTKHVENKTWQGERIVWNVAII